MSTFTLHADFNEVDGTETATKHVNIQMNTQVTGSGGVIWDPASVPLVNGVLNVTLPATDNAPGTFGYVVSRGNGMTRRWNVPAQVPGATVELTSFTSTTPLPIPTPDVYVRTVNGQSGDVTVAGGSDASTTAKGIVELATNAETTTGTDVVRAVTPAGVKAATDALALGTAATKNTGTTSGTIPLLGASGVLALARLATGTPDGTKFIADDGTLKTPSGGAGSGTVPTTSANSGTSYTVTAPTHGEARLKLTLTGSPTLTLNGGTASEACAVQLHLIQDATGSRTVTWPGNLDWGTNGAPTLSTAAGKADRVYLTTDDGGVSWQGALVGGGYTTPVVPGAPTGLGTTASSGQIILNWTQGAANGSTVTNNKIYRGTTTGGETLLTTIAANTTYTDTAVTNGTPYFYKVSAVNGIGEGAQSSEVSDTPGITTIASDDFSRADATASSPSDGLIGKTSPVGGKTWLNPLGAGLWSNLSGKAVPGVGNRKAGWNIGVSDFTFAVDITYSGGAADDGIYFRWVDANNYCAVIIDPGGYYIQKTIGGVSTNVANGGTPPSAATVRLSVVCSGTSVTAKADGVTKASGTISDAVVLTATQVGLTNVTTTVTFDNATATTP